jgi:rubrerythrin
MPVAANLGRMTSAARKPLRVDRRCLVCGYGIVYAGSPPPCPMCRSQRWR